MLSTNHVTFTLLSLLLLQLVTSKQVVRQCDSEQNKCQSQENNQTCLTCLKTNPCCYWCKQPSYTGNRCSTLNDLEAKNCPRDEVLGGFSTSIKLQDVDLSDTDGNKEAVQIKPQKIKLRLREGENVTFSFNYKAAKNYPVQLYYLMDLTNSMKAHKESLVKIVQDIGTLLSELSEHYQLAFGYYADKVAMPFYKMTPADVENPCGMLYGETCSKGFAFVHAQDFTNDTNAFVQKVEQSKFTSNLDDLENGLEPIIQILQCDEHVSWLKTSRKMILMATNSLLHMAGDGILAGVTKKNPGRCLLNSDGVLEDYLAYDYPSLEEVHRALERKKVQLVLTGAVKSGNLHTTHEDYYKSVHNVMQAYSVFVNTSEIVDTIESAYKQVTKKIYFTDNNTPNYLSITFNSSCNDSIDTSAYCSDTETGQEYEFNTMVHLSELPAGKTEDVIVISESNIDESLEIHIEYIVNKECDCQDPKENDCNGRGSFKCGICECDPTWYNANCSKKCTIDNCRFANDTYTSTTCSSKGECDFDACKCVCDGDATGDFCEGKPCDKDSKGRVCSNHGICNDGNCLCSTGYNGDICDCSLSMKNCYKDNGEESDNVTICGNRGECVCNKCVCTPGEEVFFDSDTQVEITNQVTYFGAFCQYCRNCAHTCAKYKTCIAALVENKTNSEAHCHPSFPTQTKDQDKEYGEDACVGEYYNEKNRLCTITFEISGNVILFKDNGCSATQTAGIFLTIPIFVILLGGLLALLIWKGIVHHKDKMEVAKFNKEQLANKFNMQSPIYKNPITSFENPNYPANNSFN